MSQLSLVQQWLLEMIQERNLCLCRIQQKYQRSNVAYVVEIDRRGINGSIDLVLVKFQVRMSVVTAGTKQQTVKMEVMNLKMKDDIEKIELALNLRHAHAHAHARSVAFVLEVLLDVNLELVTQIDLDAQSITDLMTIILRQAPHHLIHLMEEKVGLKDREVTDLEDMDTMNKIVIQDGEVELERFCWFMLNLLDLFPLLMVSRDMLTFNTYQLPGKIDPDLDCLY